MRVQNPNKQGGQEIEECKKTKKPSSWGKSAMRCWSSQTWWGITSTGGGMMASWFCIIILTNQRAHHHKRLSTWTTWFDHKIFMKEKGKGKEKVNVCSWKRLVTISRPLTTRSAVSFVLVGGQFEKWRPKEILNWTE